VSGDPDAIAAIAAALAADESNVALRAHLAGLLASAGRHAEALGHAARVLEAAPDHEGALRAASAAAAALGLHATGGAGPDRTTGASDTLGSGGSTDTDDAPPPPPPLPGPAAWPALHPASGGRAADVPDTADELLDRWAASEPPTELDIGELTTPGVRLADVGGMEDVKRRLELSFLAPLRNPEIRAQFGKSLRGGLVLWGPPGCGKTFIARALAGELGASFYEVGLNDVLDMWIGASERNLHGIFDTARRNRPCVLFFDEIDAIGQKRTQLHGGGGAMRGVVNQFLAELDGAGTDNEGVFMLAATNHPWDVDPALVRPGRFDRMLLVLPPDAPAREAILRVHLRGKPVEALDLRRLVRATDGLSGADLALICDDATERAMAESLESGIVRPITEADLLDGARSVRPSVDPWLETARNVAVYGNSSGTYDELLAYLKRRR
jgi:AAA+ superfamily predicted ATPase